MYIGLTQLGSQNLNFKVVHVRCINYSTDIFAFFSILNYPILASSYVYYFYFSSIEIIDIKSTPDCLAIIIIPQSTSNPNTSIRHPYFYKVYYEQQPNRSYQRDVVGKGTGNRFPRDEFNRMLDDLEMEADYNTVGFTFIGGEFVPRQRPYRPKK